MGDLNDLVERLREHAILLGGFHFNNAEEGRGSATRQVNASTLREANALFSSAASKASQAADAITSLIAERDGLALQVEAFGLTVDRCRRDASEAEAQLKAAREALEFYAEPTNYKGEFVPGGPTDYGTFTMSHHVNLVRRDAGTRARTALSLDTNKGDGV